jgi:flagellar protein FlgJ
MIDVSTNMMPQIEMARSEQEAKALEATESAAKGDKEGAALEAAAKQFEAIFVRMLLKSMRKAQEAIADKDSPFNSDQVKFYRDMHDQQIATDMTSNGSIGLADVIIQQMGIHKDVTPAGAIRQNGNLSDQNRQQISELNRQHVMLQQRNENLVMGDVANSTSTNKLAAFNSPKEFVEHLYPEAVKAAEKLNIDPKALLAQAAVETGWGKSVIHQQNGASSHNLFGIKADKRWDGEKAVVDTLEYVDNLPKQQQASFRSYADFGDSLNDYIKFVQSNSRYEQALEKTESPQEYFTELQQAGYATDPAYADKVMSVYNGALLNDLLP